MCRDYEGHILAALSQNVALVQLVDIAKALTRKWAVEFAKGSFRHTKIQSVVLLCSAILLKRLRGWFFATVSISTCSTKWESISSQSC